MRGGRSGGRASGGGGGGYRNPCLTMHQPWASLLVHGIKRVEGRSWPSPVTGRLWIHAAGKVPDPDTVAAMEAFYREIHAVDGVAGIEFPQHYPVSRLLGCVEVVGCVRSEELVCSEDMPESVRLEGLTDFCWLCENPQKDPENNKNYKVVPLDPDIAGDEDESVVRRCRCRCSSTSLGSEPAPPQPGSHRASVPKNQHPGTPRPSRST